MKDFLFSGFTGRLSKKDAVILFVLTVITAFLTFRRLGNHYAPQTSRIITAGDPEIILDFGEYLTVEQLHIFLGRLDNRTFTMSVYNEVTRKWELIDSEGTVSSVFAWNTIDVYYYTRYLGLVFTSDDNDLKEIVCTGSFGENDTSRSDAKTDVTDARHILAPVNSADYPELFDEQEMFPQTVESTYMDGTIFDEIYYARNGYEFVHGLPNYENSHPQLGKCLIALGIKLFGMNPFGWRFFNALTGVLLIPLIYLFAKELFSSTLAAAAAGIFASFDGMRFSLSRIATIDIFVAFFIIASYHQMYRYFLADTEYRQHPGCFRDAFPPSKVWIPLALSGIFMGCAAATKLTGIYAAAGLALLFAVHTVRSFRNREKKQLIGLFFFCVLFFILIPLAIYILAYIPAVEAYALQGSNDRTIRWTGEGLQIGYGWTGVLARAARNTNFMLHYHLNLTDTHPYMSSAATWPFLWRPLLAALNLVKKTADRSFYSTVSYIGNPLIWWSAIPCIAFTFIMGCFRKSRSAQFLGIAWLAQYLPWFPVARSTFIYHYLPSLLFSMLMMGGTVSFLENRFPRAKKGLYLFLALTVLFFFLFFPAFSGLPAEYARINRLKWLPHWTLI